MPKLRSIVLYVVGIGGLAFTITILWLSMRAVMDIGGACATGGPYVPAVVCPDSVVLLTPVSIFGLFIFGGLAAWGGSSLGGRWIAVLFLAWPALFISLGWNFLDYGLRPPGAEPGELDWSWLFCGIVFVLMGGIPLLIGLRGAAMVAGSHRAYAGGRVLVGPRPDMNTLRGLRDSIEAAAETRRVAQAREARQPGSEATGDVATRLERLARLHADGSLTNLEFEAAKRATLEEGGS
jgi:hypothetical protein